MHKSNNSVQYLLKCSTFGSVPNRVVSMGFFGAFIRLGDVKSVNPSVGCHFLDKKDD